MKYLFTIVLLFSTVPVRAGHIISRFFEEFQRTKNPSIALGILFFMTIVSFKCSESTLWRIIIIAGTALAILYTGIIR